jgi:hypothetical protein
VDGLRGEIHPPAPVPSGKNPIPLGEEAGRASEPFWTFWGREAPLPGIEIQVAWSLYR